MQISEGFVGTYIIRESLYKRDNKKSSMNLDISLMTSIIFTKGGNEMNTYESKLGFNEPQINPFIVICSSCDAQCKESCISSCSNTCSATCLGMCADTTVRSL